MLDKIPDDDFQRSPVDGWSYSQLCSHIIQVNKLALVSIEKCINGTATKDTRTTHWKVKNYPVLWHASTRPLQSSGTNCGNG